MATTTRARTTRGRVGARRKPRRRISAEARREAILAGAGAAFARSGFADTSMAAIASASGITPLIVYRHFDSKEALYRAVLKRAAARVDDARGAPTGRFGIDTGALLAVGRDDPDAFRVLWRHAAREPRFARHADAVRQRAFATTRDALSTWAPADTVEWAAHAVVGYLLEAVLNWLEYGDAAHDSRFVRATETALRAGVRAWGTTR
ncbi:MAG: TetR/AcrR family transcriptional regulator [Acidimicrobiia bacterium]